MGRHEDLQCNSDLTLAVNEHTNTTLSRRFDDASQMESQVHHDYAAALNPSHSCAPLMVTTV
jgi:hypothetical protein